MALVPLLPLALPPATPEDELFRPSYYVSAAVGHSMRVLGSEENRNNQYFSVAYGKPEPRFRYRSIKAQLVVEAYYERSEVGRVRRSLPNASDGYGVLGYARYRWGKRGGIGTYFDIGWGLQYVDLLSRDIETHLNSTPMFGVGAAFTLPSGELLVGARLLHLSNAGLVGDNQGQNQLFVTVSYRF